MKFKPLLISALASISAHAVEPIATEVAATLKRSADWHLAKPSGIPTRNWVIAPLYDGLLRTALTTGDAKYLAAVMRFGTQAGWLPADRVYHADDHAVGHAWLDIYLMDPTKKERLTPMAERLSYIIENPCTEAVAHGTKPKTPSVTISDRWSWCDAIYMAPPTLTRLFTATGDKKYLTFLDQEFRYTYDHLYDPTEHLFFRDATFFDKKTPAGKKTFWSRGNGWVYGGLALILEHLPKDHATRPFYEKIFVEMTGAILAAQQTDGLWRPSLLDPEQIPLGETSGSGFFTFGLAWGINHGLLDRATHWPHVTRAWDGLLTRLKPDGYVGYVQNIGSAPAPLGPDSFQDYGTGAFLLAGSEILRSLKAESKTTPKALLAEANALLKSESKTPRAYARLVPERKDDLAWENDKVAFRSYGPALRSGPEDSGIDVWCKKVPYPILDKWYDQDRLKKISYHKDHGEGFDGYHVGDTRGCGGVGLWIDGKLVTADTYQSADILWSAPDVAVFRTLYLYPVKIDGKPVYEHRTTHLRLGQRLSEISCIFSHQTTQPDTGPKPIENFPYEIAIGLNTQNKGAQLTLSPEKGYLAVYEPLEGKNLGTGVVIDPTKILRTGQLPATDKDGKNEHVLLFTKPDASGKVSYRSGFAHASDGEITTSAQWITFLETQATHLSHSW